MWEKSIATKCGLRSQSSAGADVLPTRRVSILFFMCVCVCHSASWRADKLMHSLPFMIVINIHKNHLQFCTLCEVCSRLKITACTKFPSTATSFSSARSSPQCSSTCVQTLATARKRFSGFTPPLKKKKKKSQEFIHAHMHVYFYVLPQVRMCLSIALTKKNQKKKPDCGFDRFYTD